MRDEALRYAAAGWRVLPIWWLRDEVRPDTGNLLCACGNPFCETAGKHPLVRGGRGMENASSDQEVVAGWWATWPEANIAVATGASSGIVVVDLDLHGDDDGEVEFGAWAAGQGFEPPTTLEARTGGGGKHLMYRAPTDGGPGIKNATGWLPGVDLRGDGGYALVSPSRHESGSRYEWLNSQALAELGPLLGPLRLARTRPGSGGRGGVVGEQPSYDYREACRTGPPAGTRDHFFNSRAFELRKQGIEKDEAKVELLRVWELTPQPAGNVFGWNEVVDKLERVWRDVEPEPLPDWDPLAGVSDVVGTSPVGKDTDLGNAQRFVRLHASTVRHTEEAGWFVWDGRHWARDGRSVLVPQAHRVIESIYQEGARNPNFDERDLLLRWAKASEAVQRVNAMCALARGMDEIACSMMDFNPDPWHLNVANGVLDLRTGTLIEHDPKHMMSMLTETVYDPGATDPRWDAYLASVTGGDTELEGYLRRAAGYTLTADISEEVFFIVYGPKASGKSTFLDALTTLLGGMAIVTQPETLMYRRNGATPEHELARSVGKRMIATSELPDGGRLSESLVKQITGGDKVAARHLYKDWFDYQPTFKLWIATNHAPAAYDDALWRRLRRVPFPRSVPRDEQDPRLKVELKIARSGLVGAVLAWAVRGCLEWQQEGLGSCKAVEVDTAEYEEEQDKFGRFLDDECVVLGVELAEVRVSDLFARYRTWAERENESAMTMTLFGRRLGERGFTKLTKSRPIRYRGLELRERSVWGIDV